MPKPTAAQRRKLPPALLRAVAKGKSGAAGSTKAAKRGGRKSSKR